MDLKSYYFSLCKNERAAFAVAVGSTEGHLNNVAYGYRVPATDLAVAIERESGYRVGRRELRPDDYWKHWPDLPQALAGPVPIAEKAVLSQACTAQAATNSVVEEGAHA